MLSIRDLCAGYGQVQVLRGISIEVPKGKLVTLIGSNGAGKTTTMRAVSGMLRPTSGRIELGGRDITGLPAHRVTCCGLAHSPEGRRVFPSLSVTDNLSLGAFARLTSRRPRGDVDADRERIFDLFPRLRERRRQAAGTLSGGEQQMLAMGRALMLNPDVLLLDEPSMGLAPRLVTDVFRTWSNSRPRASPCCWWNSLPPRRCAWPITATCWRTGASPCTARLRSCKTIPRYVRRTWVRRISRSATVSLTPALTSPIVRTRTAEAPLAARNGGQRRPAATP